MAYITEGDIDWNWNCVFLLQFNNKTWMLHHAATGVFAKCNLEPGFTCLIQFKIDVEQIKIEILFNAIHNKIYY